MKIAVVGAGFCGLAVTWHLLAHLAKTPRLQVEIFDYKGIGKGTSGIAAGLLHPYAGAHAKLNWRGLEGFQATQELLQISSQTLGRPVIAKDKGILRLALNSGQFADFQKCAKKFPTDTEWLEVPACQQLAPGIPLYPGLWIKTGLTVYTSLYLQGLWQACVKRGAIFKPDKIHSLSELSEFDMVIVTTGYETLQIQELSTLPLNLVKGQVLELSWPRNHAPLSCALNSHVYMLMSESKTSCLIGATYEKGHQSPTIDVEFALKELLPKAIELFPPLKEASVLNCYAGMRAVTPLHRPLMQCIKPSLWVLTGMGSKGLLYHSLFAKELVQKIFT